MESLAKRCGCRIINRCDIPQTPPVQQEPERNLEVVAPTDRIQTNEGDLAPARARKPLANWTWVSLGNNPNRTTENEIMREQSQWHILNDNNTENRPGQRHNDYDNRTSDDTESAEGDAIYSDEDGSTP